MSFFTWSQQPKGMISITWGFLESDLFTFALPQTLFGLIGARSVIALAVPTPESGVSSFPSTAGQVLQRLPLVFLYNAANLLVVDLANQRNGIGEDKLNKPWRPIPSGKITPEQTRRLMLVVVPAVQLLNYLLGAWRQGVLIAQVAWLYNDLGGGDEPFVREIFLAAVFGLFNNGSLAVAIGPGYFGLSRQGLAWTVVLGGVILTTMQVQDLKDQAGDKLRGRKSICLHVGEKFSRISIAVFVCLWSCVSGYFWGVSLLVLSLIAIVAAVVMARVMLVRSPTADAKTWRLWCFWLSLLYALPVFGAL